MDIFITALEEYVQMITIEYEDWYNHNNQLVTEEWINCQETLQEYTIGIYCLQYKTWIIYIYQIQMVSVVGHWSNQRVITG